MAKGLEFKLDAIMNAFASLLHEIAEIKAVMAGLHNNGASRVVQPRIH